MKKGEMGQLTTRSEDSELYWMISPEERLRDEANLKILTYNNMPIYNLCQVAKEYHIYPNLEIEVFKEHITYRGQEDYELKRLDEVLDSTILVRAR